VQILRTEQQAGLQRPGWLWLRACEGWAGWQFFVFRERCPDSAQRPTVSELGEDFVPAHKDLVAKLSPLSGGAIPIFLFQDRW